MKGCFRARSCSGRKPQNSQASLWRFCIEVCNTDTESRCPLQRRKVAVWHFWNSKPEQGWAGPLEPEHIGQGMLCERWSWKDHFEGLIQVSLLATLHPAFLKGSLLENKISDFFSNGPHKAGTDVTPVTSTLCIPQRKTTRTKAGGLAPGQRGQLK